MTDLPQQLEYNYVILDLLVLTHNLYYYSITT